MKIITSEEAYFDTNGKYRLGFEIRDTFGETNFYDHDTISFRYNSSRPNLRVWFMVDGKPETYIPFSHIESITPVFRIDVGEMTEAEFEKFVKKRNYVVMSSSGVIK